MSGETGFPSPAQGYEVKALDFNKILITNPPATFIMRADTSALAYKGVLPESLLVVDRSIKPESGNLVVFCEEGELHCREYYRKGNKKCFIDGEGNELPRKGKIVLFGVVTKVIHDV
jgi:DNA polymerase V